MLKKRSFSGKTVPRKYRKTKSQRAPGFSGIGYDPKMASTRRKAPPGAEKKFHEIGRAHV